MNWFKKQINRLFDSDIDDEEYYEEDVFEEEIATKKHHEISQMDDDSQNTRNRFKFPLIADEEMEIPIESREPNHTDNNDQFASRFETTKKDMKYFYQPNAISKVYDVEVSGIRELLEKRQRMKGKASIINRADSTRLQRVDKIKTHERERVEKDYKNLSNTIKRNTAEEEDPLVPKRRFTPTQVPSPVYGFKKPSNIDQLLSKKQENVQAKSLENKNDIEEKDVSSDSTQLQKEKKVDRAITESLKIKEEIDSVVQKVETTTTHVIDNQSVTYDSSRTTSFIEIEDELEEQPIVLKEGLYEKVEEFPILAEAVENHEVDEKENVELSQDDVLSPTVQEVAVTVYEVENHEGDVLQVKTSNAEELENLEQQNEHVLQTESESEFYIKETEIEELIEEEQGVPFEEVQASQELHQQDSGKLSNDIHQEMEQFQEPIQSDQVQKLVSIALSDSELMEDTEMESVLGNETYADDLSENDDIKDCFPLSDSQLTEVNVTNNEMSESEEIQQVETEPKGSKLPFNVLMLKSDKEKYAIKLAQKQMLQHNDDIKEKHRLTTKPEEFHEIVKPHEILQANLTTTFERVENNQENQSLAIQEEQNLETQQQDTIQNQEIEPSQEETEEIANEDAKDIPEEQLPTKVYVKPSFEFLSPPEEKTDDREWLESQADVLVESLSYFQVTAQVESITQGPAVTQFEITVGHGTKVSKVRNLSDDLKLALAAKDIRIQAPIPGKSTIGIEIPNRISRAVQLSEVTCSDSFLDSDSPLEAALGLDLTGKPVTIDLRKMPHGLIAGATGSGKSVCINSILISLLYKANPNELKLMLIDPKMVELAPFNHIPHLVSPVITDVKAATAALKWAVEEMERRYQLFAHAGVRDLSRFNKLADSKGEHGHKLPYILIVIDELADLMMMSPADVEEAICRIAQKARACGIHLIVATQRPSVDVITGLIKSNIPTRIAFAVSSQIDSRTIIDSQGAERLLGRGDMLYLGNGMSAPIRLQGTFVTDDEIEEIIDHVRAQGEPEYFFQQDELLKKSEMVEEQDELFEEVCRFVHEQGSASTSSIQRKYHIGYNRAARLIDMLEGQGLISEQRGSKPREVYITENDLNSMFE
ncbi:MAG TPA: DNA translocase FtsK [Ureibacillus sp.]|nr:DNA translocase FtsK [Ureibacillus sp.]